METLRALSAIVIFISGLILTFSLVNEFQWDNLLGSAVCFVVAYFIWPSKKRGHREQDNAFLDILELVIELPIEIFIWFLRLLGRIFRNKDGGFDVDIDL